MSDTGEVGSAMWGGPRKFVSVPEEQPDTPAAAPRRALDRDVVSLVLVSLGVAATTAGTGLLWGLGAAVLALGGLLLAVGVLLGLGDR